VCELSSPRVDQQPGYKPNTDPNSNPNANPDTKQTPMLIFFRE